MSLGTELNSQQQHDRALEFLEEARTLAGQLGHANDEVEILNLLGDSCLELEQNKNTFN